MFVCCHISKYLIWENSLYWLAGRLSVNFKALNTSPYLKLNNFKKITYLVLLSEFLLISDVL